MVSAQVMSSPVSVGGKKILDIRSRNEAIELMKLKSYLSFESECPRWAQVADALMNLNIPKNQRIYDNESKYNTFLQSWSVKTRAKSNLPHSLCKMLQTAKRHGVDLNPPLPSSSLRNQMPIWFHKGQDEEKNPQNNGKWAICQRTTHKIKTVGEMKTYVEETQGLRHFMRINCACPPCKNAREKGCAHPAKCRKAAHELLETLHQKWRPIDPIPEWLTEEQLQLNEHARARNEPQIFNPDLTSTSKFTDEFRVFTDNNKVSNAPATRPPREQEANDEEETTVLRCGTHENPSSENARSAFTIWYGEDDLRNITQRTKGCCQTKEMAECQALLETLKHTPRDTRLNIQLSSPYIQNILVTCLPSIENRGWINTPNREILQTIVAILRARNNLTKIGELKDDMTITKVMESARAGLVLENEDEEPDLTAPKNFQVTGL